MVATEARAREMHIDSALYPPARRLTFATRWHSNYPAANHARAGSSPRKWHCNPHPRLFLRGRSDSKLRISGSETRTLHSEIRTSGSETRTLVSDFCFGDSASQINGRINFCPKSCSSNSTYSGHSSLSFTVLSAFGCYKTFSFHL